WRRSRKAGGSRPEFTARVSSRWRAAITWCWKATRAGIGFFARSRRFWPAEAARSRAALPGQPHRHVTDRIEMEDDLGLVGLDQPRGRDRAADDDVARPEPFAERTEQVRDMPHDVDQLARQRLGLGRARRLRAAAHDAAGEPGGDAARTRN